jgi:hypothetical protein
MVMRKAVMEGRQEGGGGGRGSRMVVRVIIT